MPGGCCSQAAAPGERRNKLQPCHAEELWPGLADTAVTGCPEDVAGLVA